MLNNVSHVIYIILAPIFGVFMVSLNVLTVFVFVKKFRLQSFSLLLIVNICMCDIFVSSFTNFFYVANLLHPSVHWSTGNISCKIFKTVTMATNVAQIFSLCFINGDRIRRLTNTSVAQWTKSNGIRILIIIWITSFCLTLPRLFLFETKLIKKTSSDSNETFAIDIICKPSDLRATWYIVSSCLLFVLAYALPACYVLYTSIRAQIFMWHRRKQVHLANTKFRVLKMNHALTLTFNVTAAFFLAVWSPFFILSILDLKENILGRKDLSSMNFSLRCTLLVIGGAKPIIYVICLEKFRNALKCTGLFGGVRTHEGNTSLEETGPQTVTDKTITTGVAIVGLKNLELHGISSQSPPPFQESSL